MFPSGNEIAAVIAAAAQVAVPGSSVEGPSRDLVAPSAPVLAQRASIAAGVARIETPTAPTGRGVPPHVIRVTFRFDESSLTGRGSRAVARAAEAIRRLRPDDPVRVSGHADDRGPPGYNERLSRARACTVVLALERRLPHAAPAIQPQWFGERRPVAPNRRPDGSDDPVARRRNRRVVIAIPGRV